ncbi:MAG: YidB family protein [Pseudomonadota bacterium]
MGLFDSVIGAVTGQIQQQGGLTSVLGGLLANNGELGGLSGLKDKFNQAGMGELISSWIGKGENLPISNEQISSVLGSDTVSRIASQLGIDPAQASAQLSQILPGLIDRLTPEGVAPEGGLGQTDDLMGMLGGFLKR